MPPLGTESQSPMQPLTRQASTRSDQAAYVRACENIHAFQSRNSIDWALFQKLKCVDPDFENLNPGHWADTVIARSGTSWAVRARTISLGLLIERDQQKVLSVLRPSSIPSPLPFPDPGSDPRGFADYCVRWADQGNPSAPFNALLGEIETHEECRMDRRLMLVPHLIQIGYRFMLPSVFIRRVKGSVLPALATDKPRNDGDPVYRDLAIAQIACALNERGHSEMAGRLFNLGSVHRVIESQFDIPWYRPQLLRNRALYHSLGRGEHRRAMDLVRRAREYPGEGNQRAISTIYGNLYVAMPQPDFGKAWEASEEAYHSAAKRLRQSQREYKNGGPRPGELVHLCAALYIGGTRRALSGAAYPSDEMDRDVDLMKWCMERYGGRIELEDPNLSTRMIVRIPARLLDVYQRARRPPLAQTELDVLDKLVRVLLEH